MKKNELQYNILYSCSVEKERSGEKLVEEHVLSYVISGEVHFFSNQGRIVGKAGAIGLLRKNLLVKAVKYPAADGTPFQSLNVFLNQDILKKYSSEHQKTAEKIYDGHPIVDLSNDQFIKGYFDSLFPYFNSDVPLTEHLALLKTNEAIELLLRHRELANLLLDFATPYKIDLEAFMSQNYVYNVPMSKFAHLTGRSLATFKRDFKKIFQITPEKWLMQKRLERAHFLIAQQKLSPVAVYQEVGFENLSHFSTSFKKRFGYNASSLGTL
ncbi:helix-turn-helix domain-containing protein [Mucilaginibacter endophyticus]|uniref:helix-turn-helix domain-containing protein n=1 Tax=Mucilaginibacter endophyticus TaxID=2675003 RepID=UPI000E0D6DF8|nr:AraC family transcriptional regulator [Mucilaginibacter endophyticus]